MFVDNTKKIICLSVTGAEDRYIADFIRTNLSDTNIIKMMGREFYSNLTALLEKGYVQNEISEYQVYAFCKNPITRAAQLYSESAYQSLQTHYKRHILHQKNEEEAKEEYDLFYSNLKQSVIDTMTIDFITNADADGNTGNFSPDRLAQLDFWLFPQTHWLKHNGQLINHVCKYDNYMTFISDICNIYNIDASLFDSTNAISHIHYATAEDLSEELKTKILEHYAEDKAIYDSL